AGFGGVEIVEREAEAGGEAAHGGVAGIDQLAAPLADLVGGEVVGVGEHPAADPGRGLVDGGGEAVVAQGEGAGQAGDAAADDGDRGLIATGTGPGRQGEGGGAGGRAGEESPAVDGALRGARGLALADLV